MEKISELATWTKWKRPASIPYPNTWHRFTTISKNGKIYNIKIVDLTPDRFDESMEFTKNYFYPYEPTASAWKLMEDEVSYHNALCKQRTVLLQYMSIIAVLDEDVPKPEIVGLQKLMVMSKDDERVSDISGVVLQKKATMITVLLKNHDLFSIFDTNKILKDFGLCVKSEYRGLNIGYNIVATIEKVARAFDIKASSMVCSSIHSQIIAEKVGYKVINEIIYKEYKDDEGQVVCPVEGTKAMKFLAIKYT